MSKRKRYSEEEIINKLRQADVLLADGKTIAETCKQLGVTNQTYYKWRRSFGGMEVPQAKKLKDLEKENARLKKLDAEQALDISMLKEISTGKF